MRTSLTSKTIWSTLQSKAGWSKADWLWIPAALLVLPGCEVFFPLSDPGSFPTFEPGNLPNNSAIFCDIEKKSEPRRCPEIDPATNQPIIPNGISLSEAAIALTTRDTNPIGLDYSPDAKARCGGNPEIVTFEGTFPEGKQVCLNCNVVGGATYADANAVCVAVCTDLNGGTKAPADAVAFCEANARVSTNTSPDECFLGACSAAGNPNADFRDPRRVPEAVLWDPVSQIGVSATLIQEPFGRRISSIKREKATTVPPSPTDFGFDAGAASVQTITRGDGYVEFMASETNLSHVSGLASGPGPDTDPSLADIGFGVSLNFDGRFYIIENGVLVPGLGANGSFGDYFANQRFRVTVKDNNDAAGTATITYSFLEPGCFGAMCPETVFRTHTGAASYPFRVEASFREKDAILADVTLVRIK